MVLKSRDYVLKCPFKKLSIVLYSVNWYMYMYYKVKSPCCSCGGKSVGNCINARVSDRWICSRIIRHFSCIEALNAV